MNARPCPEMRNARAAWRSREIPDKRGRDAVATHLNPAKFPASAKYSAAVQRPGPSCGNFRVAREISRDLSDPLGLSARFSVETAKSARGMGVAPGRREPRKRSFPEDRS
jgi:hypothetical protein